MEKRVITTFVGFTALLSLAFAGLVVLVAYVTEDEIINRLMNDEVRYLQQIYAAQGELPEPRLGYMRYFSDVAAAPAPVARALRENPGREEIFAAGDSHFHVRTLTLAGMPSGILVAEASPLLVVTNLSATLVALLSGTFLIMLGLAVALAWRLARQFTGPVMALTREVRALSRTTDRPLKLSVTERADEVGYLAKTIQTAVNGLTDALARESAFTRDVSHELRTPLTVLSNTLTLLETRPPQTQDIHALRRSADRIGATVDVLLALARQETLTRETQPLRRLLEEAVLRVNTRLESDEFEVDLAVPADARIDTNPMLFGLLVANLLENARRYAAEPRMTIELADGRLSFCNVVATPLPPDPTAPSARSAASPGIGQGLYLVQRIAFAMGWSLDTRQEGTQFCAVLAISP